MAILLGEPRSRLFQPALRRFDDWVGSTP